MTTSYIYKVTHTTGQVYVSCELNQANTDALADRVRRKFGIMLSDCHIDELELFPTPQEALAAEERLYKATFQLA